MARIFLCHANKDKPQVESLYDRLYARGFEPWMDKKDLLPGQDWEEEIRRTIKLSDFVLICLSQHTEQPGFMQVEVKKTIEARQRMPQGMIHTIPIRLEPCPIPEEFSKLHMCDLFESDGFDKLTEAINHGLTQRQKIDGIESSQAEFSIAVEELADQTLAADAILQDESEQEAFVSETSSMKAGPSEEENWLIDPQTDQEDDQKVCWDDGIDGHTSNHTSQDRRLNRVADDEEYLNVNIFNEDINVRKKISFKYSNCYIDILKYFKFLYGL